MLPFTSSLCWDGTYSYSAHRSGICSWHHGVEECNQRIPPWWERFTREAATISLPAKFECSVPFNFLKLVARSSEADLYFWQELEIENLSKRNVYKPSSENNRKSGF